MEIKLNLLSEAKKSEVRRKKQYRLTVWQEMIFSAVLLFYIGILFGIDTMLDFQLKSLESVQASDQQRQVFQEIDSAEQKFYDVNGKITDVMKFQREHITWSSLFVGLKGIIPDGILLERLSTDNRTVSLSGMADTRDALLKFQEKLDSSDCFQDAKVPLSDLFAQDNIDFQMDVVIKKECLKQGNL